ncbi:hypothetical protein H7100_02515 [Candidatus Saccharibacteria bacterium]|nr:hypothetical protein [Candidatus Saccharibacteria bacterium]
MNRLTVGLDVDDVLLPSGSHTIRWYNNHFGTKLTVKHWYKNLPLEPWAAQSEDEIIERVNAILNSSDYLSGIVPIEGALEVLESIKASGDRLFGATSRPPQLAVMTYKALELCYPGMFPVGTVDFIDHSTASGTINKVQKVEIAVREQATHFIDDFETHLRPMAAAGITPLLFGDYHHNSVVTTPGLERYPTMMDVKEKLAHDRAQ